MVSYKLHIFLRLGLDKASHGHLTISTFRPCMTLPGVHFYLGRMSSCHCRMCAPLTHPHTQTGTHNHTGTHTHRRHTHTNAHTRTHAHTHARTHAQSHTHTRTKGKIH